MSMKSKLGMMSMFAALAMMGTETPNRTRDYEPKETDEEKKRRIAIADISRGKENRAEWMREKYGDDFYLEDRPRKHRYFMFLGNKKEVKRMKEILPYKIEQYPKGENKRYDASYNPCIQGQLF